MKLYRYQEVKCLERDLEFIKDSKIWMSRFDSLNDPSEGLIDLKKLKVSLNFLTRIFNRKKENTAGNYCKTIDKVSISAKDRGVYCLSKKLNNELMWAHYAQGHRGYCIEYESNSFKIDIPKDCYLPYENYCFWTEVSYTNKISNIPFRAIGDVNTIIKFTLSNKSKCWHYEEEVRLITLLTGAHNYNGNSVKAIYFGLKMKEEDKLNIVKKLKNGSIQFFNTYLNENSYELRFRAYTANI